MDGRLGRLQQAPSSRQLVSALRSGREDQLARLLSSDPAERSAEEPVPSEPRRTLLLVTGASRGLGRELAVKLTARLASGSVVVLTARNEADLMRTAEMIALTAPPDVRVVPLACDLAVADDH
ncbi:hypothetical protein FJT64_009902 [Amphibalanus amphitrite]|uniref:Sepiapterin reductase n=1 Tax=Amphibalanus amphitrite TaxID=1232801 RepID=A0A6A4VMX2_AMPAM|nr:hypothetical protein FJT64_009902 [Amphibalanus amphitrite]